MKRLLLLLSVLILSVPAQAAEKQTVIDIKVLGMVCDFCAQSVWKVFYQYDAVDTLDINLDTGMVTVFLKPGMDLSDEHVNQGIEYAGYDLVSVERREETGE